MTCIYYDPKNSMMLITVYLSVTKLALSIHAGELINICLNIQLWHDLLLSQTLYHNIAYSHICCALNIHFAHQWVVLPNGCSWIPPNAAKCMTCIVYYATSGPLSYYPFEAVTIIPARIYHSQDPLTSWYYHPVLSVIVITAISKHTIVQVNIS